MNDRAEFVARMARETRGSHTFWDDQLQQAWASGVFETEQEMLEAAAKWCDDTSLPLMVLVEAMQMFCVSPRVRQ